MAWHGALVWCGAIGSLLHVQLLYFMKLFLLLSSLSDERYIATVGDDGLVRLFNSPCVVAGAPCRRYRGHSSHVMNVRFLPMGNGHDLDHDQDYRRDDRKTWRQGRGHTTARVVTAGGYDSSIFQWKVV